MDVLQKQQDKIIVNPEFKELQEFKDVEKVYSQNMDKLIKYIYYVYKSDSIFADLYPASRKDEVCRRFGIDIDFEADEKVRALIKIYNELSKSREERHRDDVLRDMEELIDILHSTPYRKISTYKEGDKIFETTIDNTDEKIKHIKSARELIDLSEKYKTMISKQKVQDKYKGRRMFDKDFNVTEK